MESTVLQFLLVVFQSALLVGLGELGDKTQLVVLLLAIQLKSPWRVLAGVTVGAALIHLLSVWFGDWLHNIARQEYLNGLLGVGFLIFSAFLFWSAWRARAATVSFQEVCEEVKPPFSSWRKFPFLTSAIVFFAAEMGDKTQITTMALAAHFQYFEPVWMGAMLGLAILNMLVIFGGEKFLARLPLTYLKIFSASLFFALGLWSIYGLI
jgi:putative Ca2+/H+ antiporter (TMEM165/GDT1 family)